MRLVTVRGKDQGISIITPAIPYNGILSQEQATPPPPPRSRSTLLSATMLHHDRLGRRPRSPFLIIVRPEGPMYRYGQVKLCILDVV